MKNTIHILYTYKNVLLFSIGLILLSGCSKHKEQNSEEYLTYNSAIQSWQENRIISLKNNWLSLAGLFELKEGENTFGARDSNDFKFPGMDTPDYIGSFFLDNGNVSVKINPKVDVICNGEPVQEMELQDDLGGSPTRLTLGPLSWYVINRTDKIYVRLRNSENPAIEEFKGIESYPLDTAWKVNGQFEPHMTTKTIETTTSAGGKSLISSNGAIGFRINGAYYRFDVYPIGDSGKLQTIFADETSGVETYGGGRFLVIEKSDKNGGYIVDFNKAYNPPCAFTEFATCPLPPPQNRLAVKITAGEKKYQGGFH